MAGISVVGLWTVALVTVVKEGKEINWFEALSTLFSAGAFIGMLVTLAWQRLELRANTQELADQADALEEQVEVMRLSALLQSLPELIRIERDNLRSWHPNVFGKGREVPSKSIKTDNLECRSTMKMTRRRSWRGETQQLTSEIFDGSSSQQRGS